MATYKRVTYSVIVTVDPNQSLDYLWEGLPILLKQGGWAATVADPLQGVGTVHQGTVTDHQQAANGINGLRCSFDTAGIGLPEGIVSTPYSLTFLGSGGVGPYTFELHSGTLPNGLTLTSSGVLAGTPIANATFNFNVRVYDAMLRWYNESFSVSIAA